MSLAATALVAGVVGAATSAYGAMESAQAQSNAANYNAQLAAENAKVQQQNASMAGLAGEEQASIQEQKTRGQVGAIMAAQAADNIDVNSGSAVDVRSSAAAQGELSALTIRSDAAKQAYGYQVQGVNDNAQATLDRAQASNDMTAGEIGAAGDLISGVGSAGSNWEKFNNMGALPGWLGGSGSGSGSVGTYSSGYSS